MAHINKKKKADPFFMKSIHRTELDGPLQGAKRMKIPFQPTKESPLILSTSELGDFLRCRLRWNWRYRVGLQPKEFGALRGIGIIVHIGKDEWYTLKPKKRTVNRMVKIATAVAKDKTVDIPKKERELARAMLIGYSEWALGGQEGSDEAIGKGIVFPEEQYVIPLTEDGTILIRGKVDERFEPTIYKHVLAMDETKTKKTIGFDMLDLNHQMTTYLWMMSEKHPGYKRYLAYRTVIRRQMPGPRVKAALFGRSDPIERTAEELAMWVTDTRRVAKDILDAAIYPTPTESCRFDCDFYKLCLIRSDKKDLRDVIRTEYTVKTDKDRK